MKKGFGKFTWLISAVIFLLSAVYGVMSVIGISLPQINGNVPIMILHLSVLIWAVYGFFWFMTRPGEFFTYMADIGEKISKNTPLVIIALLEFIFAIAAYIAYWNGPSWIFQLIISGMITLLIPAIPSLGISIAKHQDKDESR